MEPIQHAIHDRRKKNSAKVNLTISIVFHALLVAAGAYWAAHEGVLGKRLQELSVLLVPKEKKEEAKKPEPKVEEVKKVEQPKATDAAKTVAAPPKFVAPPPPADTLASAPPPAVLPSFAFSDGGKDTGDDPVGLYKNQVESALLGRWERPANVQDSGYVAEVEMSVDPSGKIVGYDWKKGSGDQRWDDSVKKALATMKALSRPPPKDFPPKFVVRFDVQSAATEPVLQAASAR